MLGLLLRVVLSLAVVLGIVWFVARGGRRLGGGSRLVRVAGRQTLSRTASVAVVQVADRMLVLGVSEAGVRLLTELDPEQVAEHEAESVLGQATASEPASVGAAPSGLSQSGWGQSGSTLAGSMLSADTWRQAWAAATGRRTARVVPDE